MRMWTLLRRRWASWRLSTTCSSDGGRLCWVGPIPEWCFLGCVLIFPEREHFWANCTYRLHWAERLVLLKTEDVFILDPEEEVCSELVNKSSLFLLPTPLLSSCLLPPANRAHLTPFKVSRTSLKHTSKMYITLTCCHSFSFKFVANLWWMEDSCYDSQLSWALLGKTVQMVFLGSGLYILRLFLSFFDPSWGHLLSSYFMCYYMEMKCPLLKSEDNFT